MAVGSGGAERGLYQPGVMPVLCGAIHFLAMCPLGDSFVGNGWEQPNSAEVVLGAGMHDTYLQNVCPRARSSEDLCLIPSLLALSKSN